MKKKRRATAPLIAILVLVVLILVLAFPKFIDNAYLQGLKRTIPPNTTFTSGEVLSYHGAVLAFIGASFLSGLALIQNKRSTDISAKLLKLEEDRLKPFLSLSMLSEKERDSFLPVDSIIINIGDDVFAQYNENWELIGEGELSLWFFLNNLGEYEIFDIKAASASTAIIADSEIIVGSNQEYNPGTFVGVSNLASHKSIPIVLISPNFFFNVAKEPDRFLQLNISLEFVSFNSLTYRYEFELVLANAAPSGYLGPTIISQKSKIL